jgi:hypothetical protein
MKVVRAVGIWSYMSQGLEQAEQEKIAQTSVDELRRKYSELTSSFDQLRNKVLAFIAGELALIAFLFASGMNIPHVIYGLVFFLVGTSCVTASFVLLTLSLRGADWHSPGPSRPTEEQSSFIALRKACEDYSSAIEANAPTHAKRSQMFDAALMLLLIGVTILLVIKYGQGEIQWQNIVKQ